MYHLIAFLISSASSLCLVPVQVVLRLSQAWLHWRSHTLTQITHTFLTAVFHWDVIRLAALLSLFFRWGNSLLINAAKFLKLDQLFSYKCGSMHDTGLTLIPQSSCGFLFHHENLSECWECVRGDQSSCKVSDPAEEHLRWYHWAVRLLANSVLACWLPHHYTWTSLCVFCVVSG